MFNIFYKYENYFNILILGGLQSFRDLKIIFNTFKLKFKLVIAHCIYYI